MALRLQDYADASPDVGWRRDGKHYVVLSGEVELGSILLTQGPAGRVWWTWHLSVPSGLGGPPRGTAATKEDAKLAFAQAWRAWLAQAGLLEADTGKLDIVFDRPPGPDAPRLVEVEDAGGRSVNRGDWVQRADGAWVLRIGPADLTSTPCRESPQSGK